MRLRQGETAPAFEAEDIRGQRMALPQPGAPHLLLSFLRYASCPMCLLRIDELVRAAPRLNAAGVAVAVVLHSPRERILRHVRRELPFRVFADPARVLYRLYRVETSWAGLVLSMVRPSFYTRWAVALRRGYRGGWIDGEFARIPADFLIDERGTIVLAHYGNGIGDHVNLASIPQFAGATV